MVLLNTAKIAKKCWTENDALFSKTALYFLNPSNSCPYFRSVNYNRVQRRCLLLTHDRLTGSQSGGKLLISGDMDYLENTCLARYTGVCDFKPRMGLLLKTVDSVQG